MTQKLALDHLIIAIPDADNSSRDFPYYLPHEINFREFYNDVEHHNSFHVIVAFFVSIIYAVITNVNCTGKLFQLKKYITLG